MLNYFLKPLLKKSPYDSNSIPSGEVKNILIVKQHNQLGDMLCSLPLFAAVRNRFADAYITLVASKDNFNILNTSANSYVDNILLYDKSTPGTVSKFISSLRKRKYEIGIVPSTFSFSHTSHLINFISGAKTRVGVRSADGRFNKYEYLLNIKSDFKWESRKLHQVQRHLEIGEQIGCKISPEQFQGIGLELTDEEVKFAQEYISNNFDRSRIIIGFHPGAGKVQNRWKIDKFAKLIEKLYLKFGANILLTSGPMDNEVTEPLKKMISEKYIKFINTENIPLRYDAAIISKLDLYITNDTGPMHIANYLKTPMIALFGPTNAYEWGPLYTNQESIQSPAGNINDIPVETVYNMAISILKKTQKT